MTALGKPIVFTRLKANASIAALIIFAVVSSLTLFVFDKVEAFCKIAINLSSF